MAMNVAFKVEDLTTDFRVVSLQGEESISRPFRFELVVTTADSALAFDTIVDRPALLTLLSAAAERQVHGVIESLHQAGTRGGITTYRVALVPRLARLEHVQGLRVFQEVEVSELVSQLLSEAGLPTEAVDFHLEHAASVDLAVQYRESTLAFVNRLLEEHGISYFFRHHPDRHDFVATDEHDGFPSIGSLGLASTAISTFGYGEAVASGAVRLRDLEPTDAVPLEAAAQADAFTELEHYDAPGGFHTDDEGARQAASRLAGFAARRRRGRGRSRLLQLEVGGRFDMTGHPRAALNQEYLVVALRHAVTSRARRFAYSNEFEVVTTGEPFRPPRRTPRPTAPGLLTATVVGPSGETVHCDEFGRVRVRFHWDREDAGEASTAWVPVSQPVAGARRGALFLPAVGDEVIVSFVAGDLVRPVVVGSLYNSQALPPTELPNGRTRTGLTTRANHLWMDDRAGEERVELGAGEDLEITVGNELRCAVDGATEHSVGTDSTLSVGRDRHETIGRRLVVEVGSTRTESIGSSHTESIGGSKTVAVGEGSKLVVERSSTEAIGIDRTLSVGRRVKQQVNDSYTLSARRITLKTGAASLVLDSSGRVSLRGSDISIKATGRVTIKESPDPGN